MSLRDRAVAILMIERNARSAIEISDFAVVLELVRARLAEKAERAVNDPRLRNCFRRRRRGAGGANKYPSAVAKSKRPCWFLPVTRENLPDNNALRCC